MALNRLARELAAEINYHDWSDAPFRADRAGHRREDDGRNASQLQLNLEQTNVVRMNVMWVTAQVLAHADPNFDVFEYAEWCGVDTRTSSGRPRSGGITAGLRYDPATGGYDRPGGREAWDEEAEVPRPEDGPIDRRSPQVGTAEQRARSWPDDPNTPGFVTARSRNIHRTLECTKYVHTLHMSRVRGRTIHEPVWTTTGEARANNKGVCSHCWTH